MIQPSLAAAHYAGEMPLRDDAPAFEIKPGSPEQPRSTEYYTRLAKLMLDAEVRTQTHNSLNDTLALGQPPAGMRAVRTDDRPFGDLPGKNPLSGFANLTSMFIGLSRPPLAINYQWGDATKPARYGELALVNNGMTPEAFDRERSRIEGMQWDISRLVREHISPIGVFNPQASAGSDPAAQVNFNQQFASIISFTQLSAARETLQGPIAGHASVQHWSAVPAVDEHLLGERVEVLARRTSDVLNEFDGSVAVPITPAGGRSKPPSAAVRP